VAHLKKRRFRNGYFLAFSPVENAVGQSERVINQDIPVGYRIYHYKDVYIPTNDKGGMYFRGSGMNPETMDVPVYYVARPGGLRRALTFLQKIARVPPSSAEAAAERGRNLRIHLLPDSSRVVENESTENMRLFY